MPIRDAGVRPSSCSAGVRQGDGPQRRLGCESGVDVPASTQYWRPFGEDPTSHWSFCHRKAAARRRLTRLGCVASGRAMTYGRGHEMAPHVRCSPLRTGQNAGNGPKRHRPGATAPTHAKTPGPCGTGSLDEWIRHNPRGPNRNASTAGRPCGPGRTSEPGGRRPRTCHRRRRARCRPRTGRRRSSRCRC